MAMHVAAMLLQTNSNLTRALFHCFFIKNFQEQAPSQNIVSAGDWKGKKWRPMVLLRRQKSWESISVEVSLQWPSLTRFANFQV